MTLLLALAFSAPPVVASAVPAPEWNSPFASTAGWVGGDGAYSCDLGGGRVGWFFGDSFIGAVKAGRRDGSAFVNNAVAVQAGPKPDAAFTFAWGTRNPKPSAVFAPPDGRGYFWTQAAVRTRAGLFVFLPRLEKAGDGPFGFTHVGQSLAVIANADDAPAKWAATYADLPFVAFGKGKEMSFGSATLVEGTDVYVFGYDGRDAGFGKRRLLVAKAATDVADVAKWRFRAKDGWSETVKDAEPLFAGLAVEFSVSKFRDGYVAVYTENGLGAKLVARFAPRPWGPWSDAVNLYECPEAKDPGLFTYAGKAHAWAGGPDDLLVSYCANGKKFERVIADAAVYRPRFVRVTFEK